MLLVCVVKVQIEMDELVRIGEIKTVGENHSDTVPENTEKKEQLNLALL